MRVAAQLSELRSRSVRNSRREKVIRDASPRAIPSSRYAEGPFLDFDSVEEIAKGPASPTHGDTTGDATAASLLSLRKCRRAGARRKRISKSRIIGRCPRAIKKIVAFARAPTLRGTFA